MEIFFLVFNLQTKHKIRATRCGELSADNDPTSDAWKRAEGGQRLGRIPPLARVSVPPHPPQNSCSPFGSSLGRRQRPRASQPSSTTNVSSGSGDPALGPPTPSAESSAGTSFTLIVICCRRLSPLLAGGRLQEAVGANSAGKGFTGPQHSFRVVQYKDTTTWTLTRDKT